MRISEVGGLPPTLNTAEAAEVYGCSVDHLWALVRSGNAPVEPLHLGRKLVWPTAVVLRSLGLDPAAHTKAGDAPSREVGL